jgi:nucleoside-diphosphate-sugar epimerase
MTLSRRDFMKHTLIGGAVAGLGGLTATNAGAAFTQLKSDKKLRILILGGTAFLGPHTVKYALSRGHEVTLFNRGRTNAHLFPDLEKLVGDRKDNLEALKGRDWDVVIDTSGYYPRVVRDSAGLLADHCKQYIFISSVSVYADFKKEGIDEDYPVGTIEDETTEQITGETYGPLKALCEQAAEKAMPGRACNIRPGLIVGPMDRSDRFTYWPVRVQKGGEVLAPGTGATRIQVIDVRDLAEFIIRCAEHKTNGVFNADSPAGEMTMKEMLLACRKISASDARFTWADAKFLEEQEVAAWSDMPVWVPEGGEESGFGMISTERARKAGLTHRPISETIRDTLDWWANQPEERTAKLRAGLTPEREAEVLKAWHAKG